MGLFDSVLGALMNQGQQSQSAPAGGGTGLGGIMGMLGNDGEHGGLSGLVSKFEQVGLGGAMKSWIGGGPNQPVSGEQITSALGSGTISDIAAKLGVNPDEAADQLSQLLPGIINHLTPEGQAPQQGLGNSSDLMGMLGGLLERR